MASVSSTAPRAKVPLFTAEAWAPLKAELFRNLWIATSIAQIGTWIREAAGPTFMESLTRGWHNNQEMVARVLVFSNLPICLFSVFAGALADVLDRRRWLIVTQIWMLAFSALLGILTILGLVGPWTLLIFTFFLGTGTAAFGPALQAVLPELVPREHFSLAINMNSIALNVARALGPALFIIVVFFVPGDRGAPVHQQNAAGYSFLLTALSFVAAIWVLFRWRRPPQRAAIHGEEMWDAIYAGFRYTVHSPANRAILLRVLTFIVPAVVIWSQVPIIARDQLHMPLRDVQQISALLYAFVGMGAIFGVFLMPGLHGRYQIDPVVNVCTAFFGLGLILLSVIHSLWLAPFILIFLGINWVIIPTNFNTATQKSVPPWVKGRAISFYLTVLFGSFALGGAIWGHVTTYTSIHTSLLLAGLSMLGLLVLAYWFPLTLNEGKDLGPAYKAAPAEALALKPDKEGPVRIAVRYRVPGHRGPGFTGLLRDLRRTRLRNGARHWTFETEDLPDGQRDFRELITFPSWQEYARSYSRMTRWDLMLESLTREYHAGTEPPVIVETEPRRAASSGLGGQTDVGPPDTSPIQWLQVRAADAIDRIIDEMFVAYDRLNGRARSR